MTVRSLISALTQQEDLPIPWYFVTNYDVTTYYQDQHVYCPQIRTHPCGTCAGAVAQIDNWYHNYSLCECEPNYRRMSPRIHPAQDMDGEKFSTV